MRGGVEPHRTSLHRARGGDVRWGETTPRISAANVLPNAHQGPLGGVSPHLRPSPKMPRLTFDTPTGLFSLTETDGAITRATWTPGDDGARDDTPLLTRAATQVRAYFAEGPLPFDLPLRVLGSQFQQQVCAEMAAIPLGETSTYGEIAKRLKAPAQAVGQACGANTIALIIPCHRVLGTGTLGGFSGGSGVETKVWLLRHERAGGLLI